MPRAQRRLIASFLEGILHGLKPMIEQVLSPKFEMFVAHDEARRSTPPAEQMPRERAVAYLSDYVNRLGPRQLHLHYCEKVLPWIYIVDAGFEGRGPPMKMTKGKGPTPIPQPYGPCGKPVTSDWNKHLILKLRMTWRGPRGFLIPNIEAAGIMNANF